MLSTHALLHADREALVRYRTILQSEVQKVNDLLLSMTADEAMVSRVNVQLRPEVTNKLEAIRALRQVACGDDRGQLTLKAAKDLVDAGQGFVSFTHSYTVVQMRNLEINRYFTLTPI